MNVNYIRIFSVTCFFTINTNLKSESEARVAVQKISAIRDSIASFPIFHLEHDQNSFGVSYRLSWHEEMLCWTQTGKGKPTDWNRRAKTIKLAWPIDNFDYESSNMNETGVFRHQNWSRKSSKRHTGRFVIVWTKS